LTLYLEIRQNNNGWNVHKQEHRNGKVLNDTPFDTIKVAEEWAMAKYNMDRPWIEHKILHSVGRLIAIEQWKQHCDDCDYIDYDGRGDLVNKNYEFLSLIDMESLNSQDCNISIKPSDYTQKRRTIPNAAKYILWYNR
jgi:hypothetical protein